MQEHHITLADIRREAALLEFNVDISSGHLDIYHRADKTTGFWSISPFDDPRVLAGAWDFLQRQRAYLDQLDEARREIANRPPQRPRLRRVTLYRLGGFFFAFVIGAAILLATGDSSLAFLIYIILGVIVALVPLRRSHRTYSSKERA